MKLQLLTFTLAVGFSLSAFAQMPRYDVEAHCIEIASFGGSYSNSLYNSCIDMEQSAYNSLKTQWADISEQIKNHCDEIAKFGGSGSYSLLESCIEMEESAGSRTKTFQY